MQQALNVVGEAMFDSLRKARPDIPEAFFELLQKFLNDDAPRMFADIQPDFEDVYARHFTSAEVVAMLAFYSSPAGQKLVEKLPTLSEEGAGISRKWIEANAPRIAAELEQRLRAEKLIP